MANFRQSQSGRPQVVRGASEQPTGQPPGQPPAPAAHGRRGGAPAMLARASAQAGDGAGALFARLDADGAPGANPRPAALPDRRRAEAERLLLRWAERIHAGEWNDAIGELVLMAQTIERAYPPGPHAK